MEPNRLLGNRYRCTERLAIGGQGEVWRAWDTRLQRDVAIKLLHPSLANDVDYRQRFTLEARTVAALNEPAIVDLYDACEDTDEFTTVSYLVMEYVAGQPLSAIMRKSYLPSPNQVMHWIAEVSRGLHAAHQAGIVHRDIKPANIIIRPNGKATIIDFGIARRDGDPGLTATGKVLGTVSYASPEQLEGQELTGVSDIYSLGAVAYECLSGERPFEGETPGAIIAGHLGRQPDPLPPTVPPAITEVVKRALRKHPGERFADADAFADAAERATRAEPPAEPVPPDKEDTPNAPPTPRKRSRRGLIVIPVVLLLLVAAGATVLWSRLPPSSGGEPGGWNGASPTDDMTYFERPDEPPETSRLVNAATGACLDIGSDSNNQDIVKMTNCDAHDDLDFDLQPDEQRENNFRVLDEGDMCVGYGPDGQVPPTDCRRMPAGWTFEWITKDPDTGADLWTLAVPMDSQESQLCLTDLEQQEPKADTCDPDDTSQSWATEAA